MNKQAKEKVIKYSKIHKIVYGLLYGIDKLNQRELNKLTNEILHLIIGAEKKKRDEEIKKIINGRYRKFDYEINEFLDDLKQKLGIELN